LQFLKNIPKNPLLRISSLNTLSVLTRIAGGVLASKITALFIGPSGLALVGSFRNFLASLEAFSTLGMQNGIIKYTADHEKDTLQLHRTITTAFTVIACAIILCAVVLVLPADYWSAQVFNGNRQFAWLFKLIGLGLPLYAGNLIFMGVLNGLGKYTHVIYITIFGYAIGVVASALMIWQMGLPGAFLGLLATPVLMTVFAFVPLYRHLGGFGFLKMANFDRAMVRNFTSFSLMSVVTAVLGPVVYISLRNMIIGHSGEDVAGYWEGINRISVFYMMFVATLLTVYFLPKLSQSHSNLETKNIFHSYYKFVVPLFTIGIVLVYVLRKFIINVMLSQEFLPMEQLFVWQLTGDFFKVCALVLGNEFFAKKLTRAYMMSEAMSFGILYISGHFLIHRYGVQGAVMAHAFTYIIYFFVLAIYFRKKLF
jgi:O-antigen/teichoic acid export membrane protein